MAVVAPSVVSRTTARAITWPEQAPIACRNRNAINCSTVWEIEHAKPATAKTASPIISVTRRPNRSDIGPQIN